jgi:glycogen debranching enzyme
MKFKIWSLIFLLVNGFDSQAQSIAPLFQNEECLVGKAQYLNSPYATAGDKLYMVGHQDGTFPDIGWHVTGEMGGVWSHPIKLIDGFSVTVAEHNQTIDLKKADLFKNFAFGNEITYNLKSNNLIIKRLQFVPDQKKGIYIEFEIENLSAENRDLSLNFEVTSNMRPVWLGERTNMIDGKDMVNFINNQNVFLIKDEKQDWYTVLGSSNDIFPKNLKIEHATKPLATNYSFEIKISIPGNGKSSFPLVIAGSSGKPEPIIKEYQEILKSAPDLLKSKILRLNAIENYSKVTLSDKELEQAFRWIKYNNDWLIRDVEGIGRGFGAGLPDYPWWFGVDSEYTIKGLIATGRKDLVYDTIELLTKLSEKENGNGRIIHEVSTNGAVFNPGNINETPQYASTIWEVFRWTGDLSFLKKYFSVVEKGLDWLFKENDKDGNLLPDGFGMMEIHGLNSEMIDVAVYTQRALEDASSMAEVLQMTSLAKEYKLKAEKLKVKINQDFWVPEFNSYADFIGTKSQALHLIDDAIIRADSIKKPWAVSELNETKRKLELSDDENKRGFVLHHNWVVNTPMEMGIADPDKALLALNTAEKFSNPFGMFVTGIDRDETASNDEGSFATHKKVFDYTGAVMTLPTGVQIIGENNYGRPDKAFDLLKKMSRSFGYALPGSIYEVSPDFGMFTQAWNMYAFGVPLIMQTFGIQPNAYKKQIVIEPKIPSQLSSGKLENVKIGENIVSISFKKVGEKLVFKIKQKENFDIIFKDASGNFSNIRFNKKSKISKGPNRLLQKSFRNKSVIIEIW